MPVRYNRGSDMVSSAHDPLYWDDAYAIALRLKAQHPGIDPIEIECSVLHKWIIALEEFADDPEIIRNEWLEQIQAEWVEIS